MKTIVVPTDFSENAYNAVQVGFALAKQKNSHMIILHCYQQFRSAFQPADANKQDALRAREEAEQQIIKLQRQLEAAGMDLTTVQFLTVANDLPDALLDLSEQSYIELVVMGTTGASGVKYHILGSNTFNVAKQAKFPLLIVPIGVRDFNLKNISFLTDFQPADQRTLSTLTRIFGHEGIKYHLVHILTELERADAVGDKLDDWARQLLESNGLEELSTQLIIGKEDAKSVMKLATQQDTDLLALTMVERSFWDKLMDKSLAKEVIMQSQVPVFITHN